MFSGTLDDPACDTDMLQSYSADSVNSLDEWLLYHLLWKVPFTFFQCIEVGKRVGKARGIERKEF